MTTKRALFVAFVLFRFSAMRSSSGGVCTHISSDLRVINASRPGHLLCGSLHRAFPLFPSILSASPCRAIILVDRLRLNALGAGGSDFAVAAFSACDAFLRFASLRSRVAYRDDPRLCCRLQAPYFTLCLSACLPVCQSVSLSVCQSVSLSVRQAGRQASQTTRQASKSDG